MQESQSFPATSIKSVYKSCQIIKSIKDNQKLSIKNISIKTGYNLSSCYHIVNTLVQCQFLTYNEEDKTFSLGKIFEESSFKETLYNIAFPLMKELSEEIDETIYLVEKRDVFNSSIIAYIESKRILKVQVMTVGFKSYPYARSGGKLLLSTLTEDQLNEYLEHVDLKKLTAYTITDKKQLREELYSIQKLGYAIDQAEHVEGVLGLSAPLFNQDKEMVGALSLSFPEARRQFISQYLHSLLATASIISNHLGYCENAYDTKTPPYK